MSHDDLNTQFSDIQESVKVLMTLLFAKKKKEIDYVHDDFRLNVVILMTLSYSTTKEVSSDPSL